MSLITRKATPILVTKPKPTTPQFHAVGTDGRYHFILIVNGNLVTTDVGKMR